MFTMYYVGRYSYIVLSLSSPLHIFTSFNAIYDRYFTKFPGLIMAVDSSRDGFGALMTAKWRKIAEHEILKRSSHSVAVLPGNDAGGDELFVFGGELVARQPKDGYVHSIHAGMCDLYFVKGTNIDMSSYQ